MSVVEQEPLLRGIGIGKTFGGEVALSGVDFELRSGEIHGLIGSNGAGKSTLMKILAGVLPDHEGTITLSGQPVRLDSPRAAHAHGIAMIHQELSGIGPLSIAENVCLGRQPTTGPLRRLDWKRMRAEAADALAELDLDLDVTRRLDRFPLVIGQLVEIARGLHSGARVLILDEPTSALSPPEVARLFDRLRGLRDRGVSMIFISHFIEDVLSLCDRVTILRDGRKVETVATSETDRHTLIERMLGDPTDDRSSERLRQGVAVDVVEGEKVTLPPKTEQPAKLNVRELTRDGVFGPVSLAVAAGECVGLYGYVGAGHQELLHAIAGATTPDAGEVLLGEKRLKPDRVDLAIKSGVVFVGADRTRTLVRQFEIHENVTTPHLSGTVGRWITKTKSARITSPILERVSCRPPQPRLRAGALSGGNQQKIVLGKWLLGPIEVLLLEEPTRGMDVGAKAEVLALVDQLKAEGVAVLLASTEPELILSRSDRILTMARGRLTHEFAGEEVDKVTLMHHATGG